MSIILYQILYLLTGIFQTLSAQWLFYQGAADRLSFLTIGANYLGMILVNLLNPRKSGETPVRTSPFPWLPVLSVAFFDFWGNVFATAGLFMVGSGIFQVIYSSIVVFTAILSRIFLKRHLSILQWLSLLVITIGLGLSSLGTTNTKESRELITGSMVVIGCTLMFSSVYVMNEKIISKPEAPPPEQICSYVGVTAGPLCWTYIIGYTLPRWNTLVAGPIKEHQGNPIYIIICYGLLVFASFGHGLTYYKLLGSMGAVSTGVLQSLRAISVFITSSFVFCSIDTHQCFTREKAISTMVVVFGVTAFFWISAKLAPTIPPVKYNRVDSSEA